METVSPKLRLKQLITQKVNSAKTDVEQLVARSKGEANEELERARKEANKLLTNTTFKQIYYIFNNIIHELEPDGRVRPLATSESSLSSAAHQRYEAALDQYNDTIINWKPYKKVRKTLEGAFEGLVSIEQAVFSGVVPAPPPPPPSRGAHAAVADMAVDVSTNKIYWARWAAPFQIAAMTIDGTQREILYTMDEPATSVALDLEKDDIYWLEGNRRIMRGKMDGSGEPVEVLPIIAPDKGGLWQLEIDTVNRKLYWTNDISLWRTDMDVADPSASSLMVISPSESPFPIDLVVDGPNGYLYWIDKDLKMIRRSDLEGITIEDLYPLEYPTKGLKVDSVANLLYWSDQRGSGHMLMRGSTMDKAVQLDGKTEYVELGDFNPGKEFTIEMWVNPQRENGRSSFLAKNTAQGDNLFVWGIFDDKLTLVTPAGNHVYGALFTGQHHLAVNGVINGSNTKLEFFINGKKASQKTFATNFNNFAGKPWVIGMEWDNDKPSDFMLGTFSELRFWSHAKTEEEVHMDMHRDFGGNEPGLFAYYRADRRTGSILPDLTPNYNFGTIRRIGKESLLSQQVANLKGESTFIQLPELQLGFDQGFAVEAWVCFKSFKHWSRIIDLGKGENNHNIILANEAKSSTLVFSVRNSQKEMRLRKSEALKLNVWTHLAASIHPSGKAQLFVNGKVVAEAEGFILPASILRRKNYVGQSNWVNDEFFHGELSDLRLWTKPLLDYEIRQNLHRRFNPNTEGLQGYWPLWEGKEVAIKDFSGHGLHASFKADFSELIARKKAQENKMKLKENELPVEEMRLEKLKADKVRIDTLERELKSSMKQASAINTNIGTQKSGLARESDKLQQLDQKVRKLEMDRIRLHEIRTQLPQLKQEIVHLERQVRQSIAGHILALQRELQQKQRMTAEIEHKVSKASGEITASKRRIRDLDKMLADAKRKYEQASWFQKPIFQAEYAAKAAAVNSEKAVLFNKLGALEAVHQTHITALQAIKQQMATIRKTIENEKKRQQAPLEKMQLGGNEVEQKLKARLAEAERLEKDPLMATTTEAITDEISKAQQDRAKLKTTIEKLAAAIRKMEAEAAPVERRVADLTVQLTKENDLYLKKKKNIEDKIKALRKEIQDTAKAIKLMQDKIDRALADIWLAAEVPINNVVPPKYEAEELFYVPGLDGMAFVYRKDYEEARRKDAYDLLKRAEGQSNHLLASAKQQALQQKEEARKIKERKQREADELTAKAEAEAQRKRRIAEQAKVNAEKVAAQQVKKAEEEKIKDLEAARSEARKVKEDADQQGRQMLSNANARKRNAQADVDRANERKRNI